MIRTKLMVAAAVLALPLLAAHKMYEVAPYRNYINQTPRNTPISQTFVNVVDTLTEIHIWVGDMGDGDAYSVEIRDAATEEVVADTHGITPAASWRWLEMQLNPYMDRKPVRGRTYKAIFTRAGGAPISYAYNPDNVYEHGFLTDPSLPDPVPLGWDLAARVYGEMDTIGANWFGVNPSFLPLSFV